MIQLMEKNELTKMIESNEGMEAELPRISVTKGHIDEVGIKMVSEDGTDFLQGVGQMEIYGIKRGMCAKLQALWVAPECRNIGFGKVIMDHLERHVEKCIQKRGGEHVATLVTLPTDSECMQRLLGGMGYEVTGHSRGRVNMGKSYES